MAKRFYFSIVVFIAWCLFATLFYKTLCVMLLCWIWRKDLAARMPKRVRRWGMKAVWGCLVAVLWIGHATSAMPGELHRQQQGQLLEKDKKPVQTTATAWGGRGHILRP